MNLSRVIALTAIGATALTVGYRAARAEAGCRNQPNMASALESLRSARGSLERAEHNKGGWRDRAIGATDNAIRETERGCAFDNAH